MVFRRHSTTGNLGICSIWDPVEPQADLVFVHGLTGNRTTAWRHEKANISWPGDLLANTLAGNCLNVRILTFGYDVTTSNTLREHGKALSTELIKWRKGAEGRAIIFVVHGIGGLVCEQTLLICRGSSERDLTDILDSSYGICFLGTPHLGIKRLKRAKLLSPLLKAFKSVNPVILRALEPGCEVLSTLQEEFHLMLATRRKLGNCPLEIFCFYETVSSQLTGPIVQQRSTVLPQYGSRAIHANHLNMAKFTGKDDQGYIAVESRLVSWIQDINVSNKKAHRLSPLQCTLPTEPSSPTADPRPRMSLTNTLTSIPGEIPSSKTIHTSTEYSSTVWAIENREQQQQSVTAVASIPNDKDSLRSEFADSSDGPAHAFAGVYETGRSQILTNLSSTDLRYGRVDQILNTEDDLSSTFYSKLVLDRFKLPSSSIITSIKKSDYCEAELPTDILEEGNDQQPENLPGIPNGHTSETKQENGNPCLELATDQDDERPTSTYSDPSGWFYECNDQKPASIHSAPAELDHECIAQESPPTSLTLSDAAGNDDNFNTCSNLLPDVPFNLDLENPYSNLGYLITSGYFSQPCIDNYQEYDVFPNQLPTILEEVPEQTFRPLKRSNLSQHSHADPLEDHPLASHPVNTSLYCPPKYVHPTLQAQWYSYYLG